MVNKCVAHGCKTGYESEKKGTTERQVVINDENDIQEVTDDTTKKDVSNHDDKDKISTFHFPPKEKYPELRAKWIRWVNRKDFIDATEASVICEKHFDEKYI